MALNRDNHKKAKNETDDRWISSSGGKEGGSATPNNSISSRVIPRSEKRNNDYSASKCKHKQASRKTSSISETPGKSNLNLV